MSGILCLYFWGQNCVNFFLPVFGEQGLKPFTSKLFISRFDCLSDSVFNPAQPHMECLSDKCWLSRGYAAVALSNTVRISHNGELDCIRNDSPRLVGAWHVVGLKAEMV